MDPKETKNRPQPDDEPKIDVQAEREKAAADERFRINEITAIGKKLGLEAEAEKACFEGTSVDQFHKFVTKHFMETGKPTDSTKLGMTDKEKERYSLLKAVRAAATKDWSKASFEQRVSEDARNLYGRESKGHFTIPDDLLCDPNFWPNMRTQRDMTVGTGSAGGYLVGTDHLAGMFVEMLRNKSVTAQAGAFIMDGLVGDIDIPSQTGGGTWYWIDNESEDTTESALTLGSITGSPKTVSGRIDLTRRLLLQSSPSAEALVRGDMQKGITLAVDLAAINGAGSSGEPEGILNATGIGSVVGGANGAAPDWADIVDLEEEVAVDNADIGALAYVTNAKVRGKLKQTVKGSSEPPFVWDESNMLNGYSTYVSNQVPSNLDKGSSVGVCSAILFGNWNDLILFFWGGLDIKADEVTLGDRGGLVLRVFKDMDVGLRHVQSFAAMKDATT